MASAPAHPPVPCHHALTFSMVTAKQRGVVLRLVVAAPGELTAIRVPGGGTQLAAAFDELVEAKADRSLSLAICILRNGHDLFAVSLLRGHPGCRARFMLTIPL